MELALQVHQGGITTHPWAGTLKLSLFLLAMVLGISSVSQRLSLYFSLLLPSLVNCILYSFGSAEIFLVSPYPLIILTSSSHLYSPRLFQSHNLIRSSFLCVLWLRILMDGDLEGWREGHINTQLSYYLELGDKEPVSFTTTESGISLVSENKAFTCSPWWQMTEFVTEQNHHPWRKFEVKGSLAWTWAGYQKKRGVVFMSCLWFWFEGRLSREYSGLRSRCFWKTVRFVQCLSLVSFLLKMLETVGVFVLAVISQQDMVLIQPIGNKITTTV